MQTILDIHTHHPAPRPEAIVCVEPQDFSPLENQFYSVGIHPWSTTAEIGEEMWSKFEEVCRHPQVCAIGECGIDLLKGGPLFRQMLVMKRQAEISEKLGKPLVIHCVRAHDIIIGMKKDLMPSVNWLVHGFRGKPTVAKMLTDAGIWLSFNDRFNPAVIEGMSLEFMLAETDETDKPIEEIIASLSSLRGFDLTETIATNSARFLSC